MWCLLKALINAHTHTYTHAHAHAHMHAQCQMMLRDQSNCVRVCASGQYYYRIATNWQLVACVCACVFLCWNNTLGAIKPNLSNISREAISASVPLRLLWAMSDTPATRTAKRQSAADWTFAQHDRAGMCYVVFEFMCSCVCLCFDFVFVLMIVPAMSDTPATRTAKRQSAADWTFAHHDRAGILCIYCLCLCLL